MRKIMIIVLCVCYVSSLCYGQSLFAFDEVGLLKKVVNHYQSMNPPGSTAGKDVPVSVGSMELSIRYAFAKAYLYNMREEGKTHSHRIKIKSLVYSRKVPTHKSYTHFLEVDGNIDFAYSIFVGDQSGVKTRTFQIARKEDNILETKSGRIYEFKTNKEHGYEYGNIIYNEPGQFKKSSGKEVISQVIRMHDKDLRETRAFLSGLETQKAPMSLAEFKSLIDSVVQSNMKKNPPLSWLKSKVPVPLTAREMGKNIRSDIAREFLKSQRKAGSTTAKSIEWKSMERMNLKNVVYHVNFFEIAGKTSEFAYAIIVNASSGVKTQIFQLKRKEPNTYEAHTGQWFSFGRSKNLGDRIGTIDFRNHKIFNITSNPIENIPVVFESEYVD